MSDRTTELEAEIARLRAERDALAERLEVERVYRLAVEHSPVGVMCMSLTRGEYVFSNPAHAGFLGYTPKEIVEGDPHQRWMQVTHPEDFEREIALHQRLAQGEISSFESERRCIHASGEVRWARVTVVGVRDDHDRLSYIYVYFVDLHEQKVAIEERKRLEAELRQSQKLEALGRLAGGVAHDFNNRLMIIMGYAQTLERALGGGQRSHQAGMIVQSARRAAELTRQLLAYSRRQVLAPQSLDVNSAVDGMRQLLEHLIGDDIQLQTQLQATQTAFFDPGKLEQVVLNLAINARDAMPRGGQLTLATRDVEVTAGFDDELEPGRYLVVSVRDTGAGIPEDVLPRIFEPFFTTKSLGNGTGLGLSTVEGIVRQSGGGIRVASEDRGGSTFSVYLPLATGAPESPVGIRRELQLPGSRFETLMVCDDDDDVRELLVGVLRVRSYTVLEARSGRHAIELARSRRGHVDLLITDLVMPEMGGTELAARLREHNPELLVLYISGYADERSMLAGALDGDGQFLAKPFLPGELVRAVGELLSTRVEHSVRRRA